MRTKDIAEMVARWSLILLVALLPLFIIPASWASADQAKMLLACALLIVALVSWLMARLSESVIVLPRSWLLAVSALLPIAYLVSAVAGRVPASSYVSGDATQDTVAAIAVLFGALFLSALVFGGSHRSETGMHALVMGMRALLLGAGVVLIVQTIRLIEPSWLSFGGALSGSASSLLGGWHDLGIFLGLIVFFGALLWSSPQVIRGWWRLAFIVLGVWSFLLLIIINMADVWYVLAAVSLTAAVCQWGSARLRERRPQADALLRAAVCIFVGILALIGALSSTMLAAHLPGALQITEPDVRPSWQGTLAVGEKVFHGSGMLFGSGPNTFMQEWGDFKPPGINQTPFWSEDFENGVGSIPTSFVTAGLLGALAWLALLLVLLLYAWRICVQERLVPARALPAALSLGASYLTAFAVFYTPGLALSVLLFMLLGFLIAIEASDASMRIRIPLVMYPRMGLVRVVLLLALSAALLFAYAYDIRATVSDLLAAKAAADYSTDGNIPHALSLVEDALVWYPNNDAAHRAGVALGLAQLQQLFAAGATTSATQLQSTLSSTIAQGLQAVSINSSDYQNWLTLASLYQSLGGAGVSGAYQNALSAYQKAAAANPTNPLPLVGAAQAAVAMNDATSSIQYLDQAIVLKPDLAAAYYLRSQVESTQGDFPDATKDAEYAVSLAQQDPLGWYNLGSIFYASGDYADAVSALKQSVSLQNNYADALFVLALSYDKTNDKQDAIATMQQVVQLDPQDQTAAQVLANLEAGKPALTPAASAKTK